MTPETTALLKSLLDLVPPDGSAIGNLLLREWFLADHPDRSNADFEYARDALLQRGELLRGKGRGGSVRRTQTESASDIDDFALTAQESPKPSAEAAKRATAKTSAPRIARPDEAQIISYRHLDKRKNNPEVGMVTPVTDPDEGKTVWRYDPHIDPALQFDSSRAAIENLIDDALASGDEAVMRAALEELKRQQSPYLNWTGKAERTRFEVDTVSLHVHERIDPMSILAAVRKNVKDARKKGAMQYLQTDLFSAPFENLPLRDAIDFYRHERGWANRLIAGDSLLVMNSLLRKESMAGRVQMIYIDPPYGIKYGSNFQPFVNKRDVKDRKDEDLTQEPEMIKAFRDTWELGIHSYLTYLRDRLLLAKELLHESGSVFVQISDENLHHVREVMDEIFGSENFIAQITFSKTSGATNLFLPGTADYLLWYGKNKDQTKYRPQYKDKAAGSEGGLAYGKVEFEDGRRRPMTAGEKNDPAVLGANAKIYRIDNLTSQSEGRQKGEGAACWFPVTLGSKNYLPSIKGRWKTNESGMTRLLSASRLEATEAGGLYYIRYIGDFPAFPITNNWTDTGVAGFASDKRYVVETSTKVIERCLLMTTDPGDLVLDPSCGSGTTAFVAEKWGRRWITCDTSRVAVTLAKQRLLTASYDYYELRYPHEGLKGGFIYKTVPHVTLKSIANNTEIDEIYERMHPAIESALADLNGILVGRASARRGAASAGDVGLKPDLQEWEVPFDFPADWPEAARGHFEAFHAARQAMQRAMDRSIAAHADQETLYDQPATAKNKRRITGPFTVEAVPFPTVMALDEADQTAEADASVARSGESARQHRWRDELLKTGIRGKGGQMLKFAELETLPDTLYLHASGHLRDDLDTPGQAGLGGERVVVSFGPEHAALEQRQVSNALNEAGNLFPLPKMIVFCSFAFDPEAAKDIDQIKGIVALKAQMNTDLLTEDLKKGRAQNQSFWLMGQPDVEVRKLPSPPPPLPKGEGRDWYQVEVHGFDYFDTIKGELVSGGKSKIALWALDTDYDERSLFPRQVFFPMAGKGEGWEKLKKDIRAELNEGLLSQFHGTVSLPFEAGDNRKIAVKIVDDRGIESLKVIPLV